MSLLFFNRHDDEPETLATEPFSPNRVQTFQGFVPLKDESLEVRLLRLVVPAQHAPLSAKRLPQISLRKREQYKTVATGTNNNGPQTAKSGIFKLLPIPQKRNCPPTNKAGQTIE